MVCWRRRRAAPDAGLLSAFLSHALLVLGDEVGGGGEGQGEGSEGHGDTTVSEERREKRRKEGREHPGYRWCW